MVSASALDVKLNALIQQTLPNATVGIMIQDAKTGRVLYQKNADKLLMPASNVKLFTAVAALNYFKLNQTFDTTLLQHNDNIYIKFSGDPSLTRDQFKTLITQLKQHNIQIIRGDIILDASRFKAPDYDAGISYDDLGWYYAAPVSAIILNENAEAYDFISAPQLGALIQIKAKAPDASLMIVNDVVTVASPEKEGCGLHLKEQRANQWHLFGCFAKRKDPEVMQLAISKPMLVAKKDIQKTLRTLGITLKGQIKEGTVPTTANILAVQHSTSLIHLITHMLQTSDNLYADSFVKQLGYAINREGSYQQGMLALKKLLKQHTHLNMHQLELADGVGTRYNLATAEQFVVLLSDIYHNLTLYPVILKALPQAGTSGTLMSWLKQPQLEKNVFAKTGTMHDIASLSGYFVRPHASVLIFSMMINGINQPMKNVRDFEEKVLLLVANASSS
jgi:D-alanyl-D-alanine carboxypeptidase/D-alanyl-D-alanine-endopeptidase (penicillin-binding protein 4)